VDGRAIGPASYSRTDDETADASSDLIRRAALADDVGPANRSGGAAARQDDRATRRKLAAGGNHETFPVLDVIQAVLAGNVNWGWALEKWGRSRAVSCRDPA
jgi:hypothetical protein